MSVTVIGVCYGVYLDRSEAARKATQSFGLYPKAAHGKPPPNEGAKMRNAEDVTFGGSGLERHAELRGDPDALTGLAARPDARFLPMWRGKPAFRGPDRDLALIPPDHPILSETRLTIYLGDDSSGPRFAVDLSDWTPDEMPETLGAFLDPSEQHHPDLPKTDTFAELRSVMTELTPRAAELAATAKAILGWHSTHLFCAKCGAPSEPAQGGWQRDCPRCGAHHFPRTDPVVIMLITHGNDVLLGRSPGWPDGMYSLLAGFVEPGETLEAAVRREVFEEAGIRVGDVGYLASQPWPFPSSLMIGCQGAATTREINIDPLEIEAAQWVSRERMVDVIAGQTPDLRAARPGSIARFLVDRWLADTIDA